MAILNQLLFAEVEEVAELAEAVVELAVEEAVVVEVVVAARAIGIAVVTATETATNPVSIRFIREADLLFQLFLKERGYGRQFG